MAAVIDALFREGVAIIDAGDVTALERMMAEHPGLVRERLRAPGAWLRDTVGGALDGFFEKPFLLWFVAEDPVRNGTLPSNIAQVCGAIIRAVQRERVETLQEQIDSTLRLVSWSWIARECGVQVALIDVLVDAGASLEGASDDALVNGNVAAARHLVERGATPTLATALCLERWGDVARLGSAASPGDRQFGFILAALNGKAEALRRRIELGVDLNVPSERLYSHATALHHAVCSGSLDAVTVLVEAGASRTATDTLWDATPLGWAEYYVREREHDGRGRQYAAIVDYLRDAAGRT